MKRLLPILLSILIAPSLFGQLIFDSTPLVNGANAVLKTLNSSQKTVANLPFQDSSRVKWSNLPFESTERKGIQLKDLTDTQRLAIHSLLRTVLSQQGYQKFLFIIQYDEGTHERLTKANSPIAQRYGNQNYWFTIFGEPNKDKIWAWKFEGHHISLNITYSPKGVTCTPMFVGINPALVTTGPYAGSHLMFEENDFGNQLFNSLSDYLKKKAITSALPQTADVMTQTGKEAHMTDKKGVSFKEMTVKQQALVENIIRAWVENLTPALAQEKMRKILARKNDLLFTWQGTNNVNELHYYAIKTDSFIIEYTNRDQGIYHYHTMWRDLTEDFLSK
jgi:hypothetical protein